MVFERWLPKNEGRSRVGRRIVLTFLLFALVPLVVFSFESQRRLRRELEDNARDRLAGDVKSATVTLVERLVMAANDFVKHHAVEGRDVPQSAVFLQRQRTIAEVRPAVETGLVDATLESDLDRLGIVLRISTAVENRGLWLFSRDTQGKGLIAGRINPAYLFDADGIQRPPSEFSVHLSDGRLIHASDRSAPTVDDLRSAGLGSEIHASFGFDAGSGHSLARFREVFLAPQLGMNFVVTVHDSRAAIMAPLEHYGRNLALFFALTAALVVLASLVRIRQIMVPMQALVGATERLARREFGVRIPSDGNDEFSMLGKAFNDMAGALEHRSEVLRAVNDFGKDLATEIEPDVLVGKLMRGVAMMFKVDGVVVHLADDDGLMQLSHLRIRSLELEIHREDESCDRFSFHSDTLGLTPLGIDDLGNSNHQVARLLNAATADRDYDLREALVLPLSNREGDILGSLTLVNARGVDGEEEGMDGETIELAASLAGQASLALANARLRGEFKGLFDAMIEILAVAVDEKSPYTGDHCRRVPKIAMMLFDEVNEARDGRFAAVRFDEAQTYEMQVASLLHDCGKVVTPVHVIDKATKLETIWDRIHLVDQRFDLVAHERAAAEFRKIALAAGADVAAADATVERIRARLREDRGFLRRANIGGEFMSDELIERVERIAEDWRHLDLDGVERGFLSDDEKMNLCIRKGTLNDEERRVINYHMDATLMMLEQLPFPERMKDVPLIAGSHHERMDGKGFPRGLDASQIPLQGRMLAIADVFEALTATDRPYKKGMNLTQALTIMAKMARDHHLDAELLDVFLETRIWERYGHETLKPEQCDEVDLAAIREIFAPLLTA